MSTTGIVETTNLGALALDGGLGVNSASTNTVDWGTAGYILTSGGGKTSPMSWVAISSIAFAGSLWNTAGNSGLSSATNFIGTTDAVALVFKTGGAVAGFFDTSGSLEVVGPQIRLSNSAVSTGKYIEVENTDNNASNNAFAGLILSVGGETTIGDPYINFNIAGIADWIFGVDNSDADKIKLAAGSTFTATTFISVQTNGVVTIGQAGGGATQNINDHLYINGSLSASNTSLVSLVTQSNATFSNQVGIAGATSGFGLVTAGASGGTNNMTGTTQVGFRAEFQGNTNGTAAVAGFSTASPFGSYSAAYTLATLYAFRAASFNAGSGSTITRAIAYGGIVPTVGTYNAFLADNIAFTATYFINQAGTDPSVLGGALTVGVASTSVHVLNTAVATSASAGTLTLPANPIGFIDININGTARKIPYYAT